MKGFPNKIILLLLLLRHVSALAEYRISGGTPGTVDMSHTLWYTAPASAHNVSNAWMEYALPVGNGRLGAMVMGGIEKDELQFNEKTVWTGSPTIRGAYQNFGTLIIEDLNKSRYTKNGAGNYLLRLDLPTATATATWTDDEGTQYTKEYIASYPAQVIAVHITASQKGRQNCRISLKGVHGEKTVRQVGGLGFSGKLDLVTAACHVEVSIKGNGQMEYEGSALTVKEADEVVIIIAGGTDYDILSPNYVSGTNQLAHRLQATAKQAATRTWQQLHDEHKVDFAQLFERVIFRLNSLSYSQQIPTDQLVNNYNKNATTGQKRLLEQLIFHYGRYLQIASSRGISVPSNLQGIWNNSNTPPWTCDIHANINVQMNYWPCEPTNLSEMAMPFLDYIRIMATEHQEWKDYARKASDSQKGWLCWWENNIFGFTYEAHSGYLYHAVPAWYCWHLWQHWLYTGDESFLRQQALPAMLGAVDFWMERLVRDPSDGLWVCPKEWSPEQGPLDNGTAHTQQCVWNLFDITLQAIDEIGLPASGLTKAEHDAIKEKYSQLDNGLHTEVYDGGYGTTYNGIRKGDVLLREWKHYPYNSGEKGHRHVSHLMCFYPFSMVTPEDPLMEAVENAMRLRGERNTGWAMAWKLCLWARAQQAAQAYSLLENALKHAKIYNVSTNPEHSGVYYNLLCAHPPFQIDGNFGLCSGIAEMLLQSYNQLIRPLTALPDAWLDGGSISGLRTEGGFEAGLTWNEDEAVLTLRSLAGHRCRVRRTGINRCQPANGCGQAVNTTIEDDQTISFDTQAGETYLLTFAIGEKGNDISRQEQMPNLHRDSVCYDLLGRRLGTVPSRGIYVRRGHKFVSGRGASSY